MKNNHSLPTIIIACSEVPLRRVLIHTLGTLGCEVEGVASHKALVGRCARRHYALIITCFRKPLVEDYWAVRRLGGGSARTSSLFVLASNPSPSEVVALLERGVEQVLSLPVSTTRLRHKIEGSLARRGSL